MRRLLIMVAMRLGRRSYALKASRMPNAGKVVPSDRARARAEAMIGLIDASPTPYHMAHNVKEQLVARGFTELDEGEPWSDVVEAGGKYLITGHEGTIFAVAVGGRCDGTNAAFKLLGGHTDTPVRKVRPVSKRADADGKD